MVGWLVVTHPEHDTCVIQVFWAALSFEEVYLLVGLAVK